MGKNTIIVAPHREAIYIREYNLLDITDAAYYNLALLTYNKPHTASPLLVIIDPFYDGIEANSELVRISSKFCGEPISWVNYLEGFARAFLDSPAIRRLEKEAFPNFISGLSQLLSIVLEYQLVAETREVIGGVEPVQLPFDDVLAKERTKLQALHEWIQKGASLSQITPEVACGLLFQLLEDAGCIRAGNINLQPINKLFKMLQRQDERIDPKEELYKLFTEAFGSHTASKLELWGLAEG